MRCNRRFLVFSFVLLGVLVFSTGSMAVLSSSPNARAVGQFNDTLPTADGQITATEQGYCDHVQLSMDIYGVLFISDFSEIPDVFHERTVTVDFYTARNDTGSNGFIYFGVVISEVPYLAHVELDAFDDLIPPANLSAIALRFDNDGSNWIDDNEDMKVVMQGNSTFVTGMDQYWDSTDEEYESDVGNGPDPGNMTAFNMTHSDTSAQGNLGNLTMEMIMPIDSGELEDGGGISTLTNISIDYAAWIDMKDFDWMEGLGEYRTTFFYGSTSNTYLNFDVASTYEPLDPKSLGTFDMVTNFPTDDQDITPTEIGNCNYTLFSDVMVGRAGYMGTYTVDVYAANNDTMLYLGIIIPDVPYWADVDLNSTWDQQAPGNLTGVTVQFDNNNDDVVDDLEDMKIVFLGNATFKAGMDQHYNTSDGNYREDIKTEDAPPDPGDLVAFGSTHSDDTAQSNLGDLSTEMMMPLADDVNGTDGGGLSDTVGFSVSYVGMHKGYIEAPEGEEEEQGCVLAGSIADLRTHPLLLDDGDNGNGPSGPITIDASTFEDLLIEPNPVSEFSFVLLTLMSALLVATVLSARKMVSRSHNTNREFST